MAPVQKPTSHSVMPNCRGGVELTEAPRFDTVLNWVCVFISCVGFPDLAPSSLSNLCEHMSGEARRNGGAEGSLFSSRGARMRRRLFSEGAGGRVGYPANQMDRS